MNESTEHREVERKLRVHALFRIPPLAGIHWGVAAVEPGATRNMTAVYHDTHDLALFRWGITLRRREGGDDAGWHVKLPVDGADRTTRDELHLPLDLGGIGSVPDEYVRMLLAFHRGAPLVPVVTLRSERRPFEIRNALGQPVAELVDDTVAVLDGSRVAATFREIEVEAIPVDGEIDTDVIDAVVNALIAEGAVPGSSSKAASALGPRASAPCDVPESVAASPSSPGSAAVLALLTTQTRRLMLNDLRFRRGLPDAVHQMRVASRRLRSGLKVFRPLLDEEWAAGLRDELGWFASQLGPARDSEVLTDRLERHARELPEVDGRLAWECMKPWLEARTREATAHAHEALDSDRYRALLAALVEACRNPQFTALANRKCAETLPPLAHKSFQVLRSVIDALDDRSPSEQWHEARIDAKRARYAVEAIAPVFGRKAEELASVLSDVTEVLGDHQDAYVGQAALRERMLTGDVDPSTAFALGLLHGVELRDELQLRIDFWAMWPSTLRNYRRLRVR